MFVKGRSIFQMNANVSQCEFKASTGTEITNKSKIYFYQLDTIVIKCPPGMALNSSKWSQPIPHCVKVSNQSFHHQIINMF
ncbi:hypothetical protein EB796_020456 [Bugula neritina]|uniref:Sushi domain-containing protein n=1 Tax=Bugula neritina TaxID=10212 RepID=A0A7J7J739_BUGNE|nr:hypothetical protein EB796_020456 [Bugula neritina]